METIETLKAQAESLREEIREALEVLDRMWLPEGDPRQTWYCPDTSYKAEGLIEAARGILYQVEGEIAYLLYEDELFSSPRKGWFAPILTKQP